MRAISGDRAIEAGSGFHLGLPEKSHLNHRAALFQHTVGSPVLSS